MDLLLDLWLIFKVFLGDKSRSGPNDFDFYPTPKLGDFGLAELTSRDDPKNPTDYHEVGTNGWRAPVKQKRSHSV